ncbi:MAG: hypothetical protein LBD24_04860 [Spirochaetaceae bacterium]|nr:hypothetical protein [Spirochaetaceae bacterium]
MPVIPRGTDPAPAVRITGFIEEKIPPNRIPRMNKETYEKPVAAPDAAGYRIRS